MAGNPSAAIPPAPDYADASQWFAARRGGEADLFYVTATETADRTLPGGTVSHHADPRDPAQCEPMHLEMQGVDDILSGELNFFSSFHRQCSVESFTDPALAEARLGPGADDVRRAFAHYLARENGGRTFIPAGFSQGAMIVLRLLRDMDDATFSRMAAAYAIGVSIPQDLLDACPRIVPARGAVAALLGCLFVLRGRIAIGEVQAALQYISTIQQPFTVVAQMSGQLSAASTRAK